MSDSLWPHGLQHTRLLCLPLSFGVCLNSCPLGQWCYLNHHIFCCPLLLLPSVFPSKRVPEKYLLLLYWLCQRYERITINCGKFLRRWEYQTTWPAFWETCMQVKKQQLGLDMEQQTGSKLGKECVEVVYCYPASTYMQSTSWEMLGWRTSWNQDCQEKYQ